MGTFRVYEAAAPVKVMTALNCRDSAAGAAEVSPARAERTEMAWEYFIVVVGASNLDLGISWKGVNNYGWRSDLLFRWSGRMNTQQEREASLYLYSQSLDGWFGKLQLLFTKEAPGVRLKLSM